MRLNLGSGTPGPEGWININLLPGPGINFALDMRRGLPFADNEADYAVCHHVLDLFDLAEMVALLHEVRRVLKPGGVLRVSLASQEKAFDAWCATESDWFSMITAGSLDQRYEEFVLQHGARKQYLDEQNLERIADLAGFYRHKWEFTATDAPIRDLDTRPDESFFAEFVTT